MPLPFRRPGWRLIVSFVLLALAVVLGWLAHPLYRSTRHFVPCAADARVLYEPGAEAAAANAAVALPQAIEVIERAQLRPFARPVRVYVCATTASFDRFGYGIHGASGVVLGKRLFLSPRATPDRIRGVLTHELSHLHLEQWRGTVASALGVPAWFKEGLAVHVSGMGAGNVTESEARDAIRAGRVFRCDRRGAVFPPQTAARDGLPTLLFYRECALFVGFLAGRDHEAFSRLLLAIEDGRPFAAAVEQAYAVPLAQLWDEFRASVKDSAAGR